MISIGVDVSQGKSTICILKPYGEILKSPYEVAHTESSLKILAYELYRLSNHDEVHIIMEATGIYHFPILNYLQKQGFFVTVVNPLSMKKYINISLRQGKTDKIDSIKIANYGIDNWYHLIDYQPQHEQYNELRSLSRQYLNYTSMKIKAKVNLTNILEKTMPGIKQLFPSRSDFGVQNKVYLVAERYWHFDNIKRMSRNRFIQSFIKWANKVGIYKSEAKADALYSLATEAITTLPADFQSTKMLVLEAVRILREIELSIASILAQMQMLAADLPELQILTDMPGIGKTLAVRLIAEIGDVRRFRNANALIAYAGLDSPPYQSGAYSASKRHISKRGSPSLRKTGYEIINSIRKLKPDTDNAVYIYTLKKESEGKPLKVAKIAGLNKFLRIYYARVKEVYGLSN